MEFENRLFTVVVLLFLLFCIFNLAQSIECTDEGVVINTHDGKIRGLCERTNNETVTTFYGVPYAKPPIGSLRWAAPQKMDKWGDVVRNATSLPNICPQDLPDGSLSGNEDCLYLNIYVPGEVVPDRSDPLSVLVWIHGKFFRDGSANEIEGKILAVEAEVIVVTINYRLGVFGFLSFDHDLARGNYGFRDQILALEWVKVNADKLGADPNSVTIAGGSAGGKSATLHLVSPKSKGLFARAIIHSGFSHNLRTDTPTKNKDLAVELSQHTRCNHDTVAMRLTCMRNVNVSETFSHLRMIERIHNRRNLFVPVIDGELVIVRPLITASLADRPTNLLIGVVQDEGSIMEDVHLMDFNRSMNATVFKRVVKQHADEIDPTLKNQIIAQYYPTMDNPSSDDLKNSLLTVSGDFAKGFTRWRADKMSESGGTVYMFLFTHRSSFSSRNAMFSNVPLGDDLDYVLGRVLDSSRIPSATEEEKDLSRNMITAWASFVKNRKPDFTPRLNITWPKYTKDDPKYMIFSTRMNDNSVQSGMAERARLFYGDVIIEDKMLMALRRTTTPSTTTTMPMTHATDPGDGRRFDITMEEAQDIILALTIVLIALFVILVVIIVAYCIDARARRRRGISKYEASTKL